MYKLLLLVLMVTVWMILQLQQVNEEVAMKMLFMGKRAVNRAAHAAALQLDREALSEGILRIDEVAAKAAALSYLAANLRLDANGRPLEASPLREPVEVLIFEIINDDHSFPYVYRSDEYNYEATLRSPGVILIVRMEHPGLSSNAESIGWNIKGVAEHVSVN
ncbi:hypothetical protein [Paenibacillus sp. NEAU-GSW1]|uniref:hypothetical protein n=1 Tax=Paenibacillus sp. NEAU-GSW1 TaxID=2682486 RepID=UPI0012E1AB22|nr:hypothetical protein [Paenibacillus sp. NEAU-GSW1]MUT68632.1 hypothetical protein [Paenibacillus sp. NEAU-GSW1]